MAEKWFSGGRLSIIQPIWSDTWHLKALEIVANSIFPYFRQISKEILKSWRKNHKKNSPKLLRKAKKRFFSDFRGVQLQKFSQWEVPGVGNLTPEPWKSFSRKFLKKFGKKLLRKTQKFTQKCLEWSKDVFSGVDCRVSDPKTSHWPILKQPDPPKSLQIHFSIVPINVRPSIRFQSRNL